MLLAEELKGGEFHRGLGLLLDHEEDIGKKEVPVLAFFIHHLSIHSSGFRQRWQRWQRRRLEGRERHASILMHSEKQLTPLFLLLPFIAGCLPPDSEVKLFHSLATSYVCFCCPASQLSKINGVLKWCCQQLHKERWVLVCCRPVVTTCYIV